MTTHKRTWYFSFVDPDDDVFLGSAVICGATEHIALSNSWRLGLNPGDPDPMIVEIPEGMDPPVEVNRYYSLAEMIERGDMAVESLGPNTRAKWESFR